MRPLSPAKPLILSVLEYLCWKWKPTLELYSVRPDWFEHWFIYENFVAYREFDLCASNIYILVRVHTDCFRFKKNCFCQASLQPRCSSR
jgi:hypothetical protein